MKTLKCRHYLRAKLALLYRKGVIEKSDRVEIHDILFENIFSIFFKRPGKTQKILAIRRTQFLIPTGHFTKPAIRHPVDFADQIDDQIAGSTANPTVDQKGQENSHEPILLFD